MTGYDSKRAMAADKMRDCIHGSLARSCQICDLEAEIEELKAALAQPAQEPVAWTLLLTGEHHGIIGKAGEKFIGAPECYQRVNVYTAPPKREWVGLTDEEILALVKTAPALDTAEAEWLHVVRAAEQSLKEKNT